MPATEPYLLNKLTGVNMPRGSVTQTRTFNYNLTTGCSPAPPTRKPDGELHYRADGFAGLQDRRQEPADHVHL